jgi:uncharacterized protein
LSRRTATCHRKLGDVTRHPQHAPPLHAGAGLKPEHIADILGDNDGAGFFEVHAENYMSKGGAPHAALTKIRERFPVFVHGVGLSIGSPEPLDRIHLQGLKTVVDRYEPLIVSEHLAWSTHGPVYFNDLLPVPYTRDTLNRVVEHIDDVQSVLGRTMLLENPSTYVAFERCDMSETDFIAEVQKRTGCGLLLDLNNVFVSATNHKFSAEKYLAQFPLQHVREIHLAGHAQDTDENGDPLLIDAHDREVSDPVWQLYAAIIEKLGSIPTLIEWDNDVPAWPVLKREAQRADEILNRQRVEYRHAG